MQASETELHREIVSLKNQQRAMLRGLRVFFALVLLILMALNFRMFFALPGYRQLAIDMLNGTSLSPLTRFVFTQVPNNFIVFAAINLGVPLACVVYSARATALNTIIVLNAVVSLLLFVEWQLLASAVMEPLRQIVRALSS